MIFLFKPRRVVVDCFINQEILIEECPIKRSSNYLPEWWKKLEHTKYVQTPYGIDRPFSTMKTCSGFVHMFSNSWTIPLWSDIIIKTGSNGDWKFLAPKKIDKEGLEAVTHHSKDQYGDAFDNYIHAKLECPWVLSEKQGINFFMTPADWTLIPELPDLRIPSGFLNFKHIMHPNVNMFLPRRDMQHNLNAGVPIVYLVPLTEKKVEFKNHLVSDVEYAELSKRVTTHFNKFKPGVLKWR